MEEEAGKLTVFKEMAGRQEALHSEPASSTSRKFQAVVTCIHSPAKFWARIGEAKSLKNFEGYLATLNEWCSLQKGSLTELPKAKSYIAIKLDSLQWQRAQVLKIINDERVSVFCIDTGVTAEISVEQICAKQMPILMQQPTQAIQCSLADITSIRHNDWSEEAILRFKSLVQDHTNPVYVEFQTIKQLEGQMCGEILLFISDPSAPERIRSIGKILSNEGLAQYVADGDGDDDDDDISVTNKHASFAAKGHTANVNANSVTTKDDVMDSTPPMAAQESESSDDVVVEESSSEDERSLIANSSGSNVVVNVTSDHVIAEGVVESEQVIGPSHLVENKNSFNIISRVANYSSSSSSSSEEDEDTWDDSLLGPIKPKPASGIMAKADVEKNLQKRKALHAKFNEFLSTPLPPPASSGRHPFGSRGKRGSRRGAQGAGRYMSSGRGSHPTITSGWSNDLSNQTRGGTQHVKAVSPLLSSPGLLSSTQQPFSQQFPQQQFPQQQFPQQQFPQQQFPQQQLPQQQFPRQQFPQRQFPHQPQQQFFQQPPPHTFPQQQFPGQQLSPSKQDQPWQHNHSKLRQFLSNKSPINSTPPVASSNTSTNITSIDQLDEKGKKNEYEWQKWMIERSVKKALEGLSEETVNAFTSQLKKILSDSSATTLNKFANSKGATWVVIRTVCSQAVDKPMQCSKAVIALREIYKICTDEVTRLFPQVMQDCSEQVLKEITSSNSQCGTYCDFVCCLHRSTANDDTSLHLLINSSLDHLLRFWTDYALDVNSSGLECGGCANLIITVFTNIAPHLTVHNWTLLERCCKMVRSLILSSLPVSVRERLLDFYMIITRQLSDPAAVENVTDSLSSLSVDKAADQTEMSDSTFLNAHKSNHSPQSDQSPVKPNQSSVEPDQSSLKPDQSSVNPDQSSIKPEPDQSSVTPDQSSVTPAQSSVEPDESLVKSDQFGSVKDQSSVKPNLPSVRPNQSPVKTDHSSVKPDQSSVKLDHSVKPDQGLIRPDQFLVKPDQAVDQISQLTTTTLDAPSSHPTVVMATKSHDQDMVPLMANSSNTLATVVDQLSPPLYDPYCKVSIMLNALNLSYLLDNFKAAIIQDNVLSCDPSGLKEAMKEAGIPSGAVLSITHYLSKQDTNATRVQFPAHQQSYYQFPVQHNYPTAAYGLQPSAHVAYLQQQPHPLASGTQFTTVPSPVASHQISSIPAPSPSHQLSQQVLSPVGIPSPTHPLQQQPVSFVAGWMDGNKMTQVVTGQRP